MNSHFRYTGTALLIAFLTINAFGQLNQRELEQEMEELQLALQEIQNATDTLLGHVSKKNLEELTKTFHKEETNIKAGTMVRIDNKYGDVDITTWDQNKISIDVNVTVRHSNEKRLQKKLDEVQVEFRTSDDFVEAITHIECETSTLKLSFGSSVELEIDYVVKMPKGNPLRVKNRFGSVFMPDMTGRTNIDIGYGSLTARSLLNEVNDIRLLFSRNCRIDQVKEADLSLEYSGMMIEAAGTLDVKSRFSDLEVEKLESGDFDSQYDKINVDYVRDLLIDSRFSTVRIDQVHKELVLDNAYGYCKITQLDRGFETCRITNQFAKLRVGVEKGASFDLEVTTKFARMDYPSSWNLNVNKDNDRSDYNGKVNGGKTLLTIRSNYGNVEMFSR